MSPKDTMPRPGESSDAFLSRIAAQAAEKKAKGRRALLDEAEPWRPPAAEIHRAGEGGKPLDPDEAAEELPGEKSAPLVDHVTIPRFVGKPGFLAVRWVPVSMPPEPPITCLGKMGRTFFYLSPLGELIGLQDSEHGQAHIAALWAPQNDQLERAFPQFDQSNRFKGFQANYARDAMMRTCAAKGLFDAHKRVRGLGCWRADDGALVQHLGNQVLVGRTEHKPGELDGYVYPGRPSLPRPTAGGRADSEKIYQRFQCWNFERGEVDARLLLGQLAAGVLGAAIDWRPMAFLTGDAGTGKSTLQRTVRDLLPDRIISTVDASEAALRALLGQDALIVSFDEIEADAHSERAQAVMRLARTSASGDDAHRSGQDQVARSFTLRGSFLFSAIVPPSMRQQDMQRFAFLRMRTLTRGAKLPPVAKDELKTMGQALVGRITEGWSRWDRTLSAYFDALQARRHEHRGAMQFGTCLAAAHILLQDEDPTDEDLARWCDPLHRDELFEYENNVPTWLTIWRVLLSSCPDVWRSHGSPTVSDVIKRWMLADLRDQDGAEERRKAQGWLNQVGLHIVRERGTGRLYLAISPKHQALSGIFRGTDFQASGGEGAWNIPLRGAPKVDGDRGVLRVEKVPNLGRQKCPLFWLGGSYAAGGSWEPIFEANAGDEEIAPPLSDRLTLYMRSLAEAEDLEALQGIHGRSVQLRDELDDKERAEADEAFNARWIELEGRKEDDGA